MLICPDCGSTLWPREILTAPGGRIQVDHCPTCRGTWFDHWEINRLPRQAAEEIFRSHPRKPGGFFQGSGLCPHCGIPLIPLKSESVPEEVTLFTCHQCQGNWISQTQLIKLKKAQEEKITLFKIKKIPLPSIYSVLIPLLIFAFLGATTLLTAWQIRQTQKEQIRAQAFLGAPQVITLTPSSVKVIFATSFPTISQIEYQTAGGAKITLPVSSTPTTIHQITLRHLKAQTSYNYRLLVQDQRDQIITSSVYSFITP